MANNQVNPSAQERTQSQPRLSRLPRVLRYGLAVAAVAAGLGARQALTAWVGPGLSTYITFYPPVLLAALLGGFGPGLLATALAGLAAAYWVLPPVGHLAIAAPVDRLGLVIFTGMGLFMSAVAELYRRGRHKAAAYDREAALRESQARLAVFAASTFEGVVESEAGRILDCNEQYARMFGYSMAELRGMEIASLAAPEDRDRVREIIRRGRESAIEHTALRKDGTRIVLEAHGRPVSPGSARRHSAVRDITARKRAEERIASLNRELQQRLQELETVFHTVPMALGFAEDPQCHHIRGNPAMQRLLGVPPDRELSKSAPPDQQPPSFRVFQDGRELAPEELPMQMAASQGRSFVGQLLHIVREDGQTLHLHCNAAPLLDERGKPRGAVGAFLDVTEQKLAEEALRASRERLDLALLSSRMATFDWDIVHNKRIWSQGVHRLLGTKPETFTGAADEFFQVIHPEDRSTVQAALAKAVQTTGEYETEYRAVWPDGGIHHISARGKVHRDNAGRAVQMTGVCWDITDRKRAEALLRESEERYRSLFNTVDAGFCVIEMLFDAQGRPVDYRFLEVNAAFERQTGLHDAEGKSMRELAPAHEAHWFEIYGKIALTGEARHFVNEARALDRWYDVYAYRVGALESRHVAILFNDITAHKQAETELRRRAEELRAANEELTRFNRITVGR